MTIFVICVGSSLLSKTADVTFETNSFEILSSFICINGTAGVDFVSTGAGVACTETQT